jgi:hypothetical protein
MIGAWKNYFSDVMILNVKDQNMTCYNWSGEWNLKHEQALAFKIDSPSIFKIAKDTERPYHGYVVPNPVNQQFFDQTYGGKIPEHVTLAPVASPQGVETLILGVGSKQAGQKVYIHSIEMLVGQFSEQLKSILSSAPKLAS